MLNNLKFVFFISMLLAGNFAKATDLNCPDAFNLIFSNHSPSHQSVSIINQYVSERFGRLAPADLRRIARANHVRRSQVSNLLARYQAVVPLIVEKLQLAEHEEVTNFLLHTRGINLDEVERILAQNSGPQLRHLAQELESPLLEVLTIGNISLESILSQKEDLLSAGELFKITPLAFVQRLHKNGLDFNDFFREVAQHRAARNTSPATTQERLNTLFSGIRNHSVATYQALKNTPGAVSARYQHIMDLAMQASSEQEKAEIILREVMRLPKDAWHEFYATTLEISQRSFRSLHQSLSRVSPSRLRQSVAMRNLVNPSFGNSMRTSMLSNAFLMTFSHYAISGSPLGTEFELTSKLLAFCVGVEVSLHLFTAKDAAYLLAQHTAVRMANNQLEGLGTQTLQDASTMRAAAHRLNSFFFGENPAQASTTQRVLRGFRSNFMPMGRAGFISSFFPFFLGSMAHADLGTAAVIADTTFQAALAAFTIQTSSNLRYQVVMNVIRPKVEDFVVNNLEQLQHLSVEQRMAIAASILAVIQTSNQIFGAWTVDPLFNFFDPARRSFREFFADDEENHN